jgi:hypothetical protein
MTKNVLGVSFGVLILLAIGFYVLGLEKEAKVVSQTPKENGVQILLFRETGEITYKLPSAVSFVTLSADSIVIPNLTIIKTTSGKGSVLLPDNSMISIASNTELSINYTENAVSIFQSLGSTYHRVESLVTGKTYQVQTPGTLAAVRGTKFAVTYDKKKSLTKVAVTESKVAVSRIPKGFDSATTTPPVLEEMLVKEGDMAQVIEVAQAVSGSTTPSKGGISLIKNEKDPEMDTWIKENKTIDPMLDKLKVEIKDKENLREEIKQMIKEEVVKQEEKTITPKERTEEVKKETTTDTVKPSDTTAKPTTQTVTAPVRKLSEEQFFDEFNTIFINAFYVDERNTPCLNSDSPETRVNKLATFVANSGYTLPSGAKESLLVFAKEIKSYCENKDDKVRTLLQGRFDQEFPFQEDL